MFSKKNLTAVLLTLTLLVAPASFAAPSASGGLGWMDSVTAFFADFFSFLRFEKTYEHDADTDGRTVLSPTLEYTCTPNQGETGSYPEPSGCP